MKIGLIGYGKMNRLIEKACQYPIVCITRDYVKDFSADLYIDFSHASLVKANALLLAEKNKTLLIGTTGWDAPEIKTAFNERGAALYLPNFSIEVAKFCEIALQMTKLFGPPDKATEWHHKSKKDAPSGTAKRLSSHFDTPWDSIRTEETIFKHSLQWKEITLTHEAKDRTAYVQGALEAAKWLYGKKGWHDDFCRTLHTAHHSL